MGRSLVHGHKIEFKVLVERQLTMIQKMPAHLKTDFDT